MQGHVEDIAYRLGLDVAGQQKLLEVRRMGSREYGCAEQSSDLDLYLMVPDDWASHAKQIRVLLGAALEECQQAKDGVDAPEGDDVEGGVNESELFPPGESDVEAVSYTHLTLPTILLV